jgi:hypothetical protein
MKKLAYILPFIFLFTPLLASASCAITYQGKVVDGFGTAPSPMFSNVPIGTASSNRRVLIAIIGNASYTALGLTDITVNGTSVGSNYIAVQGGTSWQREVLWAWADVPTGTTANVDVTYTTSPNGYGTWIAEAYTFDNTQCASAPTHHENTNTSNTTISNQIATQAKGFLVGIAATYALTSTSNFVVSASDETLNNNDVLNGGPGLQISSKTSSTASSASSNITWTWTTAVTSFSSMLFWGPAPATAPAPARKMRLFEGFKIKLISGKMILYQQ